MGRILRRTGALLLLAFGLLIGVLAWNTWRVSATQPSPTLQSSARPIDLDPDAMARRLGEAIAIPTVSATPDAPSLDAFLRLHALLEARFPRLHAELERERINEASLLFHWRGRETCAAWILTAHQDVVPVEAGTESAWTHPPFAGVVDAGAIWGRGAIDDKAALIGLLEAVEHLLDTGFSPRCDVWLAFGHDEEIGGQHGALALAQNLKARGVQAAFVLDEGGAITRGAVPGTDLPLATIGVAEKGYVSLRLSARADGGHSSMPPRHTAVGRVARAVTRLEAQRPEPYLGDVQRELLHRLAPHVPFGQRLALSNLWLFEPFVVAQLARAPSTDATLRTTTAPTLLRAGVRENVLAQQAEAVVNFRIRPGDSVEGVFQHARRVVDDEAVAIEAFGAMGSEPTVPAPWDDPAFARIERALRQVSPEPLMVVAPYVTSGATDARHYAMLTDRLYRFVPMTLTPELLASFHGTDERVPVQEYLRSVRFYIALLRADGG